MTDQSDTGDPTAGLDMDTVKSTVKTLFSHLITRSVAWRGRSADVSPRSRRPIGCHRYRSGGLHSN
eukprot:1175682-Prorocentrum_minimum.AAC.2